MITGNHGKWWPGAYSHAMTGAVMVLMGVLAVALSVPLWLIIGLAFVSGATMTIGAPGYVSIVNDLVPPGAVSSGVALNFLGISVGRIAGGFIGGTPLLPVYAGELQARLLGVAAGVFGFNTCANVANADVSMLGDGTYGLDAPRDAVPE